ncbi:hypothetical protein WDZ92_44560, partial [Nostoc sp. NIES-2111]
MAYRTTDDTGCHHASRAQDGHEHGCLKSPVRPAHARALATRRPSPGSSHLGRGPRLFAEDESFRIELQLATQIECQPLAAEEPLE